MRRQSISFSEPNDEWLKEQIASKEIEVIQLEEYLAKEEIYSDAIKLQEATRNYNSTKAVYEQLQASWESLAEEIMDLEG